MSRVSTLLGGPARTLSATSACIPIFGQEPALEAVSLKGSEGVNGLFEYELRLKTPDALNLGASAAADFDLDAFIGHEISCCIHLDGSGAYVPMRDPGSVHVGAGERQINALITDAVVWGEEGRHVQYLLTLRPWLHLATLDTDCKIFQNKTVVEIIDELLADYAFPIDKRLIGPDTGAGTRYPVRDYQTQFNESDFAFFERLCQEWGINYFFEHSGQAHRLVLTDNMRGHPIQPSAAYRQVDFHAPGWKTDAEYIHAFAPSRRLGSGRYVTSDYDYTRPLATLSAASEDPRATRHAGGEVHEWHASRAGSHYAQPRAGTGEPNDPHREGRAIARLRMEALRTHGARAQGSGNLRGMVPGCTFELQNHPRQAANAGYLVLDTRLLVEDVGQASQTKDSTARRQRWQVQVDFTAHSTREVLRPAAVRSKPRTGGPQPARVVGPAGQNLWTDEFGRIKVQFPWDRVGKKDQHASCWVRVSSQWAGNQLGGVHLPRIGQEVLIDFYGGDPDLPVCRASVANQSNKPPWALPGQSALSGFRSRELTEGGGNGAGGRSNHLVMDDSAGEIQAQLKSDHRSSSLSLGYITRVEDHAGRKDARGEGLELRTDGHGAVRAGHGLLLTTEPRPNAERHITDMQETVARLVQARGQHEALAQAAAQARAQEAGDQDAVVKALQKQNDALQGRAIPPNGAPSRVAPELSEPHLVLASPAGIHTSSAQSTHLQTGEHLAVSSGSHTSVSAGRSFLASAKEAVRLFSYKAGMRLIAYAGDIEIKALKNSIEVMAQLAITQTAECISITARKELRLNGGGSYFKLDAGGIEGGTNGLHRVYAATHGLVGPRNAPTVPLEASAVLKEKVGLIFSLRTHADDGGRAAALEPYTLYKNGAAIKQGVSDSRAQVQIEDHQPGSGPYKVRMANGNEIDLPVSQRVEATDSRLAAQGYRIAQDEVKARWQHRLHFRGDKDSA